MTANTTLQAEFLPAQWTLTIGAQSGGATEPPAGKYYHLNGDVVNVSAINPPGQCFTGWSGLPEPQAMTQTMALTMNQDYCIEASFGSCTSVPLTIEVEGPGYTNVGAGTRYYEQGETVVLEATPYGNSGFIQWREGSQVLSSAATLPVAVDAAVPARTITARFDAPFSLDDFQQWLIDQTPEGDNVPNIGAYMLPPTATIARDLANHQNDMPDFVWLSMFGICMGYGPYQDQVRNAYWANVSSWINWLSLPAQRAIIPEDLKPSDLHTYAAYCTLSDTMRALAIAHFLSKHPGITSEFPSFASVPALGLDGDADGDGFANIDEWIFANQSSGFTLAANLEDFHGWIPNPDGSHDLYGAIPIILWVLATAGYPGLDTNVPNFAYHGAWCPCVQVTVNKEGNGEVEPWPGALLLPKYRLCDLPQYPEPTDYSNCRCASLVLHAFPCTGGSPFQEWAFTPDTVPGAPQHSIGKRDDSTLTVPLDRDRFITAYFTRPHQLTLHVEPPHIDPADPTSPPPGEAIELSTPMAGGGWDFTHLNLTVHDTQRAWRFSHWENSTGTVSSSRTIPLTLDRDRTLTACYYKFDLPDDLNALVSHVSAQGWQTATLVLSEPVGQHAVPDVVNMAVMQHVLDNSSAPMHQAILDAYTNNYDVMFAWFAEFEAEVPGYERPDNGVISALAASAVYSVSSFEALYAAVRFQEYLNFIGTIPSFPTLLADPQPPAFGTDQGQLRLVSQMAAAADLDGDGFSNVEEWIYAEWKYGIDLPAVSNWDNPMNPFGMALLFGLPIINMSSSDAVPVFSAGETGAPPTVQATIAKEGEGDTNPAVGTYSLPKYRLTSWWDRDAGGNLVARSEGDMTAADFASLTVQATASDDWTFRFWRGGNISIPTTLPLSLQHTLLTQLREDTSATKTCLLATDCTLRAWFEPTPLKNYIGNLPELVGQAYEDYGIASYLDYSTLQFDTGEISIQEDFSFALEPNGIPDYAEFALLQRILTDPTVKFGSEGGVEYRAMWRIWNRCHEALTSQIVVTPAVSPETLTAVTAMLTMGTQGHRTAAKLIIEQATGVVLDMYAIPTTAERWLGAEHSASNSTEANQEVWQRVAGQQLPGADPEDVVAQYANEAVTGTQISLGGGSGSGGSGGGSSSGPCCWNQSCIPRNNVRIENSTDYWPTGRTAGEYRHLTTVTATLEDPCGTQSVLGPLNDTVVWEGLQPRARKIRLAAQESLAPFWLWAAWGSLANDDWRKIPRVPFVNSRPECNDTPDICALHYPIRPYNHPMEIQYIDMTGLASCQVDFGKFADFCTDLGTEDIYCPDGGLWKHVRMLRVPLGATLTVCAEPIQPSPPSGPKTVIKWGWYSGSDLDWWYGKDEVTWTYSSEAQFMAAPDWILEATTGYEGDTVSSKRLTFDTKIDYADSYASAALMPMVNTVGPTAFFPPAITYRPDPIPTPCPAPEAKLGCNPWPGYFLVDSSLHGSSGGDFGATWESVALYGNCDELRTLDLIPTRLDMSEADPGSPSCMGEITADPAAAGYLPTAVVTLRANAFPGYRFMGWIGDGKAYLDSACTSEIDLNATSGALPSQPCIRVKMETSRTVLAVFESAQRAVVVKGAAKPPIEPFLFGPSEAPRALERFHYDVAALSEPTKAKVKAEIVKPNTSIFVFLGHGDAAALGLQWSSEWIETLTYNDVLGLSLSNRHQYHLVVMEACSAGTNGDNWTSAFGTDAYVGFRTGVPITFVVQFDSKFWELMGDGKSSEQAANSAAAYAGFDPLKALDVINSATLVNGCP
jgi:hypothetical protein